MPSSYNKYGVQDMAAGTCFQTNVLTDDGDFTVKMTPDEHEAFTQCGFTSMEGFELAEQLECSVCNHSEPLLLCTPLASLAYSDAMFNLSLS